MRTLSVLLLGCALAGTFLVLTESTFTATERTAFGSLVVALCAIAAAILSHAPRRRPTRHRRADDERATTPDRDGRGARDA